MLPLQARVDLEAMAIKEYSAFPQNSSITEASPSDCLASYPGHSLGKSYSSTEKQLMYSTAPTNWDRRKIVFKIVDILQNWMKIIFWYPRVLNWSFCDFCYHKHLVVNCTFGKYVMHGWICFKLAVTVLVKYLTRVFVYLHIYVAIHIYPSYFKAIFFGGVV